MPQILLLQQASLCCASVCDMHMKMHNNNFHVNQFSNETNFNSWFAQQEKQQRNQKQPNITKNEK